jgi:hypothetical protein
LQERLGLPIRVGALDFNLGCRATCTACRRPRSDRDRSGQTRPAIDGDTPFMSSINRP